MKFWKLDLSKGGRIGEGIPSSKIIGGTWYENSYLWIKSSIDESQESNLVKDGKFEVRLNSEIDEDGSENFLAGDNSDGEGH